VLALDFDPDGVFLAAQATRDPRIVGRCRHELALARAQSIPLLGGAVRAAG
jgi:hypothetical protein